MRKKSPKLGDKIELANDINALNNGKTKGRLIKDFDLQHLEKQLHKNVWISKANVYFDNKGILNADIEERHPIAQIFSMTGNGFYLDSNLKRLPQTDKFAPRLPVFTNFPNQENGKLTPRDSNLIAQVKVLSSLIAKDSFMMAMIDQVDIRNYQFEMVPKIGRQIIVFGDTSGAAAKVQKLKLFYKEVMAHAGSWGKYSEIDLSYRDQVVARLKGKDDAKNDSLRTLELLDIIARNAAMNASDSLLTKTPEKTGQISTDVSMVQQSVEREDMPADEDVATVPMITAPKTTPAVVKPAVAAPKLVSTKAPEAKKKAVKTSSIAKPVAKPATKPNVAPDKAKTPVKKAEPKTTTKKETKKINTTPQKSASPQPKAVLQKKGTKN